MPSLINDLTGLGSMFGQPPKRNTTQRQLDQILAMYGNMYSGLGYQAAQARGERYSALASQQFRAGDMLAMQSAQSCDKYGPGEILRIENCLFASLAPTVQEKLTDPFVEAAEDEYCKFAMIERRFLYDKNDPLGVFA